MVSCLTIWFSSGTLIVHPPDLLGRPNDLKDFHKSIVLPTGSLSFFFEKAFFVFCYEIWNIISCCFMYFFVSMKPSFLYFLKSLSQIISFSEILLLSHPEFLFYSFIWKRQYFINDFHKFLNEAWINIIHISKMFIISKFNFPLSVFINISCFISSWPLLLVLVIFFVQFISWWSYNLTFNGSSLCYRRADTNDFSWV